METFINNFYFSVFVKLVNSNRVVNKYTHAATFSPPPPITITPAASSLQPFSSLVSSINQTNLSTISYNTFCFTNLIFKTSHMKCSRRRRQIN
ncbi:hypothetical protein L1887_23767 [Cichorium endivia]|nr:hypothetical protein L1887_23767 [Cichorium endivia]